MFTRLACLVVLALAALGIAAPLAGADSLVFIRANNVWIANQDGSGAYQVTLDGTAAAPYEYPSEADDGTIVAVRAKPGQRRQLYRMHQNGGLLNPPINTPAPGTGAINAKVSPDGRYVAYWFVTTVNDPVCAFCVDAVNQALISHSDRFTNADEPGLTPNTGAWPTWISNSQLLLSGGAPSEWFYTLGSVEGQEWFDDSGLVNLSDGEASRTGGRLAIVRGNSKETIQLYSFTSTAAAPTMSACGFGGPSGQFADPVWTNDGSTLAWQENDGVWASHIVSLSDCPANVATRVIPGGSSPDFGPAPVNPGPRPGCGNPGNPVACGGPPPPPCSPNPCPGPPVVSVAGKLRALLRSEVKALRKLHSKGLRKRGVVKVRFTAPSAGLLTLKLARKSATLASGRHRYARPGRGTLKLKLTSKGRKALEHAHRSLRLTLSATFTPRGGKAVKAHRSLALKR